MEEKTRVRRARLTRRLALALGFLGFLGILVIEWASPGIVMSPTEMIAKGIVMAPCLGTGLVWLIVS